MKTMLHLTTLFIIFLSYLPTGCGLTGRTIPFTLEIPKPASEKPMAAIKVAEIDLEEDSTQLISVGVYGWGEFDTNDLKVIEKSLNQTLSKVSTSAGSVGELNLHVVIRRYLVAASNNQGFALACVAWCATNEDQEIVFHEQFYASKAYRMASIGDVKMAVHKGVVRRIAENSVLLASSNRNFGFEPVMPKNTYNSFEEAARKMPKRLASSYTGSYDLGSGYYFYAIPGSSQDIDSGWASESNHINWEGYLSQKSKSD